METDRKYFILSLICWLLYNERGWANWIYGLWSNSVYSIDPKIKFYFLFKCIPFVFLGIRKNGICNP